MSVSLRKTGRLRSHSRTGCCSSRQELLFICSPLAISPSCPSFPSLEREADGNISLLCMRLNSYLVDTLLWKLHFTVAQEFRKRSGSGSGTRRMLAAHDAVQSFLSTQFHFLSSCRIDQKTRAIREVLGKQCNVAAFSSFRHNKGPSPPFGATSTLSWF